MPKNKQIPIAWYVVIDYFAAALAWACFYFVRKAILKQTITDEGQLIVNNLFWLGTIFIPASWLVLFTLAGAYNSLYKKSRFFEFTNTFTCILLGCIVIFFAVLLDDVRGNYSYYYLAYFFVFAIHFVFIFTGRWFLLSKAKQQLLSGEVFFNTLMIGSQNNAISVFRETEKNQLSLYRFHYS